MRLSKNRIIPSKLPPVRSPEQTTVRSTFGKEDFASVLLESARFAAADVVGGLAANKVGAEYKLENSSVNYLTHKLAHGIIGAGMGALSNGDALSGAIGATIGEIMGEGFAVMNSEAFDPIHEPYNPETYGNAVRKGTALAQISAALVAGILGQDPKAVALDCHNPPYKKLCENM